MARPSYRGFRRPVLVAACLVFTAGVLAGSRPETAARATPEPLRVLQMNLCDSGIAQCYTGRSVAEAAAVIRADMPDVITVNEVCQSDVSTLDRTLVGLHPGGTVVSAFKAATDRRTGEAFRCRDGEPYGIGLLAYIPMADPGYTTSSGIYPVQDHGDPEERAWLCLDAIGSFYACATHLASTSPTVALAQCDYLLGTVIPDVHARDSGYEPTVVGGDFNLSYGGTPDMRSCVPASYLRKGDGGVQDIVVTTDFTVSSDRSIGMDGTTDHPGLLVALTVPKIKAGSGR
jgi:hypothetical protein